MKKHKKLTVIERGRRVIIVTAMAWNKRGWTKNNDETLKQRVWKHLGAPWWWKLKLTGHDYKKHL